MSKRNNVSYIKPADPKFLRQLKEEIGYKEGVTVETKRQKLEYGSESDSEPEEQPQVIVLKKGDLTAEEADQEKKRIEKEESEKPADLNQRIVFKSKKSENQTTSNVEPKVDKEDKKRNRPEVNKSKLSFQDEEDEEDEE